MYFCLAWQGFAFFLNSQPKDVVSIYTSQYLCAQELQTSTSWREGTEYPMKQWKVTFGLRYGCLPGCKWWPEHSPAHIHSFLSHLSFGEMVLFTHCFGLVCFCFLCFCFVCGPCLQAQERWSLALPAWHSSRASESWAESSPSLGLYPCAWENLSDWLYMGHSSFLCQSLVRGVGVLKSQFGHLFSSYRWNLNSGSSISEKVLEGSFIDSCSRQHWRCPCLMPVLP